LLDSLLQEKIMSATAGQTEPVTEQPAESPPVMADPPVTEDQESVAAPDSGAQGETEVAAGGGWLGGWGSYIQNAVNQPHLLEAGITAAISQATKATTGATQMVKSKSMEVVKAVSGDLSEVGSSIKTATTPILPMMDGATNKIKGATGSLKNTLKDLDEVTDEMTEAAMNGISKSASSFWNMASGYASQMFTEDDLPSDSVLVGADSEPIILDRLQAQLHALATDPTTYTQEPDPKDGLAEDWTVWLANLDLDKRQGEISELMINNAAVRKQYSKLVPTDVSHKLFWARYFYKVHLIEKQEVKRQVLKKRAEKTKEEDGDAEINWDDDDELDTIPEDVQAKLLSEYEQELKITSKHAKKDSSASDDWEKVSDETK